MGRYYEADDPDSVEDMLRQEGYWQAQRNALRGKRGQAFLRELLTTLDAMPDKRLARGVLYHEGAACALGQVITRRISEGQPVAGIASLEELQLKAGEDDEDEARERTEEIGVGLGIPLALVRLVAWENDEAGWGYWRRDGAGGAVEDEDQMRWRQVREWAQRNLQGTEA